MAADITITNKPSFNTDVARRVRSTVPPKAQEKIRKFVATHRRRDAERLALYEQQQELVRKRGEVDAEMAHTAYTLENRRYEGPAEPWAARLAELRKERDALTVEIEAARDEGSKIGAAFPIERIDAYLAENAGRRFKTVATPVTLAKGETPAQALQKVRARINEVRDAIDAAATARLPAKQATERAIREIEALAAKGNPYFARTRLVDVGESGRFSHGTVRWPLRYDDDGMAHIDAVPLIVSLFKDELIKRAKAECAEVEKKESGEFEPLTLEQRRERISKLESSISELERHEGALLDVLGDAAAPRHDMHVGALLGVEIDKAPPPKRTPEAEPIDSPEQTKRDVKRSRLRDPNVTPGADPDDFG
jgi:hypothetical protein